VESDSITTAGVGCVYPAPTPDVQLDHCLDHAPKLGIPVEMVQFLMKLLLKKRILALYRDFYSFWQPNFILLDSESGVGNFGKVGVGVGHFTSDSATLVFTKHRHGSRSQAFGDRCIKTTEVNQLLQRRRPVTTKKYRTWQPTQKNSIRPSPASVRST